MQRNHSWRHLSVYIIFWCKVDVGRVPWNHWIYLSFFCVINLIYFYLVNLYQFFLRCNSSAIQCPCMCTHVVNDALCRGKKYHRHARVYSGGGGSGSPFKIQISFIYILKLPKTCLGPPANPRMVFIKTYIINID